MVANWVLPVRKWVNNETFILHHSNLERKVNHFWCSHTMNISTDNQENRIHVYIISHTLYFPFWEALRQQRFLEGLPSFIVVIYNLQWLTLPCMVKCSSEVASGKLHIFPMESWRTVLTLKDVVLGVHSVPLLVVLSAHPSVIALLNPRGTRNKNCLWVISYSPHDWVYLSSKWNNIWSQFNFGELFLNKLIAHLVSL